VKVWDDIFAEAMEIGTNLCNEIWTAMGVGDAASVQWSKFLRAFLSQLNIPYKESIETTTEVKCLMAMMGCSKNQMIVNQASFKRVFSCIGPFIESSEILDQVKNLMETAWFMGSLSATEAEKMILPLGDRSYLVRFSPNSGEFSITFKEKDKLLHTRVPNSARFNLHNYIQMLITKKSFRQCPPSPFRQVGENSTQLHAWKFVR